MYRDDFKYSHFIHICSKVFPEYEMAFKLEGHLNCHSYMSLKGSALISPCHSLGVKEMIIYYLPSCTGAVLHRKESSSGKGPIGLETNSHRETSWPENSWEIERE